MTGTLFIVATPIGNLGDMTFRAIETLKRADFILCEDTRVTRKLLEHYEIKTPVLSYHEHSDYSRTEHVIQLLKVGKSIALVSDAGTPGISDPGGKLVSAIIGEVGSSAITPIPGPCALIAAASIAGFSMDKFIFLGFPPSKKRRKKFFEELADCKYPIVLYESTHRILKSLGDIREFAGAGRQAVVCRELTKKFETVYRGTVAEILGRMEGDNTKGEFVIILK